MSRWKGVECRGVRTQLAEVVFYAENGRAHKAVGKAEREKSVGKVSFCLQPACFQGKESGRRHELYNVVRFGVTDIEVLHAVAYIHIESLQRADEMRKRAVCYQCRRYEQ